MDLRQLSALIAVAEGGSISAAARSLHTVQSNISSHLARLERELGVTLFDRTGGFLTEEGQAVVRRARRVQAELDALGRRRGGAARRGHRHGAPRVHRHLRPLAGAPRAGGGHGGAPEGPRDRRRRHHQLARPPPPRRRARPGGREPPGGQPGGLHGTALRRGPPADRARRTTRSPALERVGLAELADHELLLEPSGTAFRDELDREAAAAGIELRAKAEVDGLRLIATLAFQGFGAAIVPATAAPDWLVGSWRRVPVDGLARRSVGLARRSRGLLPAPARALRETVLGVVATEGPGTEGVHPAA